MISRDSCGSGEIRKLRTTSKAARADEKLPVSLTAVRYSGTLREKRYEENKALLEAFIRRKRFNGTGEEIFARYTSTLMPCFSGRIEVVIPVKPKAP